MLTHDMMLNFTQNETATDVINIVKPRFALLSSFVGRNSYWNVAGELKFSTLLLFYVIYSVKEKRVSHIYSFLAFFFFVRPYNCN